MKLYYKMYERRLNEYPWKGRSRVIVTSDHIIILYYLPILSLTSFITYIPYLYRPSLIINIYTCIMIIYETKYRYTHTGYSNIKTHLNTLTNQVPVTRELLFILE